MRSITQWPSWLYQRYSRLWEHAALSAGWAWLYVVCDASVDAFPIQWRVVLAVLILVGGVWKPIVAYALFIAAVAYPLYLVSVYLMALALAVLILSAPAVARFLPQLLTVLISPIFAPYHLTPVWPLLAGVWWGETAGAVVGGATALWLKLCAGMTGASPGLWQINGWTMAIDPLYARFHDANSLQTLVLLGQPLARDSLFLLFNVLQVLAWTAAGFVAGYLARRLHTGRGRGWTVALSLGPALVILWAGYVAVPSWLQIAGPRWLIPRWLPAQVLLAGVGAWVIDSLARYFQRPVVSGGAVRPFAPRFSWFSKRPRSRWQDEGKSARDPLVLIKKTQPQKQNEGEDDIIMLELD